MSVFGIIVNAKWDFDICRTGQGDAIFSWDQELTKVSTAILVVRTCFAAADLVTGFVLLMCG